MTYGDKDMKSLTLLILIIMSGSTYAVDQKERLYNYLTKNLVIDSEIFFKYHNVHYINGGQTSDFSEEDEYSISVTTEIKYQFLELINHIQEEDIDYCLGWERKVSCYLKRKKISDIKDRGILENKYDTFSKSIHLELNNEQTQIEQIYILEQTVEDDEEMTIFGKGLEFFLENTIGRILF